MGRIVGLEIFDDEAVVETAEVANKEVTEDATEEVAEVEETAEEPEEDKPAKRGGKKK